MRRRRRGPGALLLVAAVATRLGAQTTTTTSPGAPAVEEQTQVRGTLPDLAGRWLVLPVVSVAGGASRTIPSVWEITTRDGKPVLHERLVILPDEQSKALDRANDELHVAWEPSQHDLDAIARAWDALTPEPRGVVKMTHELVGRDAFDDAFKKEKETADAQWAVRQVYGFEPGGNHPATQVNLFGITREEQGVYSGHYIALTVVSAPFPVPIKFEGTVRLLPLGRRSFWTRLGDLFAGCSGTRR